jgi:C1A family cysteine protease
MNLIDTQIIDAEAEAPAYSTTSELVENHGMGWLPDRPDIRDYTFEHEEIKPLLARVMLSSASGTRARSARGGNGKKDSKADGAMTLAKANMAEPGVLSLPSKVDLRQWFSPIEDQGQIGSCTANAGIGLLEYFERKAHNNHVDASRLFLYKVTRNLLHWTGDTGAYLRSTMKALVCFGAPPEEYWPYNTADYDKEPTAFMYAFADNFEAIKYYRLDPPGTAKDVLLNRIKTELSAGLPSMFGFTVYSSISQAGKSGKIPIPRPAKVCGAATRSLPRATMTT